MLRSLSLLTLILYSISSTLGLTTVQAATGQYCQQDETAIAAKTRLLAEALKGNEQASLEYGERLRQDADSLRRCRRNSPYPTQAVWLRLYPCDVRRGSLDAVLDRIVNKGYNTVYVEAFADSQVLLPPADNPTAWNSLVRGEGNEEVDLLASVIQKGHQRGLKVYAWVFTLNFGYLYAQKPQHQALLARNGKGQDSTTFVDDQSQAFIDPYHPQVRADYSRLIQAILKRQPDGILFDYVRYPRGTGTQSVAGEVKDLWIYSSASRQTLLNRAQNNQGRALINRYLEQGYITPQDLISVSEAYPEEGVPLWQGRNPSADEAEIPLETRYARLKAEIWLLAVAHAAQGVVDFVAFAASMAQKQGIPSGAVFFPDGNQVVGEKGFDSRLQAWDQFPPSMEWHPMSYGVCNDSSCIVKKVERVVEMSPANTQIIPALAGLWGENYDNRPDLEEQMQAIRSQFPQVQGISHFAFSWQEPEFDKKRRFC
ncbi:MAG: family 10 glycosylhydrolase [Microcystaceae cyanobacterium]